MNKLTSLLLAAVLLTACSKKEIDPQPSPADTTPVVTMARTLTFPTAASLNNDTSYVAAAMTSRGVLGPDGLGLSFEPRVGRDAISFGISAAALTPAVTGTYPIIDRRQLPGAAASASYSFRVARNLQQSGEFLIWSSTHTMPGQLVITSYDALRRLVSGSYEMSIDNLQNITDRASVPMAAPLCNLRVTGTFANVKLQ